MRIKNKVTLITAIIFGFGLMVSVPAQARNLKGACKADIEKVCKNINPGEGRIADCLKDNIKKISKDCKEKIEKAKKRGYKKHARTRKFKDKNEAFLKGFEKGFARGFERGFERGQKHKLNKKSKNRRHGIINACKADIKKLCGDVKHGEGRIKACLEKNKKKLSKKCSTACETVKERRGIGGERRHRRK